MLRLESKFKCVCLQLHFKCVIIVIVHNNKKKKCIIDEGRIKIWYFSKKKKKLLICFNIFKSLYGNIIHPQNVKNTFLKILKNYHVILIKTS